MEQVVNVQSAPKEPTATGTLPRPALPAIRGGLPSIPEAINGGSVDRVRNSIITARKRSLGQGNFLHLSVILFTGGYLGMYTPGPGTHSLWDQVHPLGPDKFPLGPGKPPWDQVHPLPRDQVHPMGSGTSPLAVHAGRYGQQAGGTHPTGMQSC